MRDVNVRFTGLGREDLGERTRETGPGERGPGERGPGREDQGREDQGVKGQEAGTSYHRKITPNDTVGVQDVARKTCLKEREGERERGRESEKNR